MTILSDGWFYGDRQRSSNRSWIPIIVLLLLFIDAGIITYLALEGNQLDSVFKTQIASLNTSLDSLKSQISVANTEISALKEAIKPGGGGDGGVLLDGTEFTKLYNKTKQSVVLISVTTSTGRGTGSGFIYDTEGHIITNNHVIENAKTITVTFIDGTILKASLIGRDPYSDMAVIKVIAPQELIKPIILGDSSKLNVGQTVIAIGNPFGLASTMTTGIVSAISRQMDSSAGYPIVDVIQTDAAINPGNSGGPLYNINGEVIGMNTAIIAEAQQSSGIGFAIPSMTIKREIQSLIATGSYEHPLLGIQGIDVSPNIVTEMKLPIGTRGTLVSDVTKSGPSDVAGLKGGNKIVTLDGVTVNIGGDIIIGADGKTMKMFYDLIFYIQRTKKPGDTIVLQILRDGSTKDISVTLGKRPPPV